MAVADEPLRLSPPSQAANAAAETLAVSETGGDSRGPTDSSMAGIPEASATALAVSDEQARHAVQWLASLALEKAPRTYDGDKDWGKQKKLWAGVKVRRDGWKLNTHRRWKEVNHGRWLRYAVAMPPATAANGPQVTVHDVGPAIDPLTGQDRIRIRASIVSPLTFTSRLQRWNLGVRLFSMTVSGDMRARLLVTASIGFHPDYSEVPPALVVDPRIEDAQLVLEHFEVNKISHLGGDVAEGWGELVEELIAERFIDKQNQKLVSRLNRSIEKERDDLRISLADWLLKW